jgi:predicted transcriptional regulator of viral defense system
MNRRSAEQVLRHWDKRGRYVFARRALAKLFAEESPKTFTEGLNRMVRSGLLLRACRGVYLNPHANCFDAHVLERIALALRPGEYNYLGLESVLAEYGEISQIPVDRLTVVTTGRKGNYRTPYGVIEFTHTQRAVGDILSHIRPVADRPLRIASKEAAWRDLKRVGRNVAMVSAAPSRNG